MLDSLGNQINWLDSQIDSSYAHKECLHIRTDGLENQTNGLGTQIDYPGNQTQFKDTDEVSRHRGKKFVQLHKQSRAW